MRERIRDKSRLEHIVQAIESIESFTAGFDHDRFVEDPIVSAAVSYNIVVIGEAVYKLTKEFKEEHDATPWQQIEGMRHVMAHGYYVASKDTVWKVVEADLPVLRQQVQQYLDELNSEAEL